jgi:hypothetical protein
MATIAASVRLRQPLEWSAAAGADGGEGEGEGGQVAEPQPGLARRAKRGLCGRERARGYEGEELAAVPRRALVRCGCVTYSIFSEASLEHLSAMATIAASVRL